MGEVGATVTDLHPFRELHRPRLSDALASPAEIVVLVGPVGAGATTLLRQWAARFANPTWFVPGSRPDVVGDALVIDAADRLDAADWDWVGAARRARPQLLVRAAVRSHRVVPADQSAEFVFELSFTRAETAEYLAAIGSNLDPAAVHLLTGGLPIAVRAAAQLKTVRAELVNEMLAGLRPGSLASEEARLAVPGVLTQRVVAELGGAADFLDRAESAGMGHWVAGPGHPLFVLTAPVRAATLKAHPIDDAATVRGEASRILLAQEAWFGAIIEGASIGSLDVIDAALRGGGMPLLADHGQTIAALLRSIPILELRRWPIIAMALALILNARREHRLRAVELLGIALVGARRTPARSAERALLRLIEAVLQRLLGIGDGGVKAARAAVQIVAELPDDEHRTIKGLLGDLHLHSAITLMYGGQYREAIEQFENARTASARPGIRLASFGGAALIHALTGDLAGGQEWVETALERPWPDHLLNEYQGSMLRIAQAKILIEKEDLDAADAALDEVWHIVDTIEHWPLLAYLRAMIDICRGRADEGLERFRMLRRRRGARMPRSQVRLLDLTESSLALAAGDLPAAAALTPRAGDLPLISIGAARAEMFSGRYERALQMLGSIPADGPEARVSIAVLEAVALYRLDRPAESARAARRARSAAEAHGLKTPFLLLSADDRNLFGVTLAWEPVAVPGKAAVPQLTDREHVVLRSLVEAASLNDIAAGLHVSVNTVKSQRRTLYRKLGASSREEALAIAVGHGLLGESRR
ncbi:helix-turn-helix transcriptional regulator [Microbacterium alcoholitolerans]|uniref:helix-turn-helix transcriptional regulator n=1 Tax=unclassified Microbacterium TaxID=2609290 RepID=UPI003D16AC19